MRSGGLEGFQIVLCGLLWGCAAALVSSPAGAQTEYDADLQRAEQQEEQYRSQLKAEEAQVAPYRQAYIQQLDKLESLTRNTRIAHGRDPRINKQISSLTYWLKAEDEREAREMQALNNLDGWRVYWQSRRDGVLRTQAWNQEQIEMEQREAAAREFEAQAQASRDARYQAMVDSENAAYDQGGGGYGGYYRGGRGYHGHSYHGYHGHTIHISHGSHHN